MNRQAPREVGCTGKGALTALVAKTVARAMRERGSKVNTYKCLHCGAYHVGSSSKKKAMRGRPRREELELGDG
jgi:hypothetical protein